MVRGPRALGVGWWVEAAFSDCPGSLGGAWSQGQGWGVLATESGCLAWCHSLPVNCEPCGYTVEELMVHPTAGTLACALRDMQIESWRDATVGIRGQRRGKAWSQVGMKSQVFQLDRSLLQPDPF